MFTLHFTDNITTQRWHLLHKRVCQRLIYLFSSRSKEYHFKNNEEKLCCQVVSISAIDMLFLLSKERWQLNSSRVELKALHLLVQDQAMYHLQNHVITSTACGRTGLLSRWMHTVLVKTQNGLCNRKSHWSRDAAIQVKVTQKIQYIQNSKKLLTIKGYQRN